jgi:hypothetical protein
MRAYSEVLDAYDKGRYHIAPFRKYRSTSAYTVTDLSYGAGIPIANYYASTPLVQAELPTKEGIFHGINNDKFLHKITIHSMGSVGAFTLLDYLAYIPFLDGDSTDEQVLDTHTLTRYADGKGVKAMLVSQGSGTLSGNATLKYTNSDGVSGRTAITFVDGTGGVGQLIHPQSNFLQLQQGDSGIQKIESFTFSTGIGGIYALVLVKPVVTFGISDITAPLEKDFFSRTMDMPKVHKDAYLNFVFKSMTAQTINLQAQLEFVW